MKRALPFVLLAFAACSSQQPRGGQPVGPITIGSYTSDVGPEPTGVIPTATIHDSVRNKDLEISVYYPTRGGPFPVIIFSPGYGGSASSYEPLVSYWTSNGYVVIRPSHADAGALKELTRDTIRDAYQQRPQTRQPDRRRTAQSQQPQAPPAPPPPFRPNPMEAIWDKEREPQWRDRVADIKLIIDKLGGGLQEQFPELRYKIDATKIGVGGHSYGAFTAMLIGGMQTFGNPRLQLGDPRVKAILAMSPQGPAPNRGLTADSWANLNIPAMFMTGSQDRGTTEQEGPDWRKQAFHYSPAGDKYFILIQGARHTSFTGTSAAAFDVSTWSPDSFPTQRNPANPGTIQAQPQQSTQVTSPVFYSDRTIFQRIKLTSLVFWEAYLKGQTAARDQLVQDKMPSGVTLEKK